MISWRQKKWPQGSFRSLHPHGSLPLNDHPASELTAASVRCTARSCTRGPRGTSKTDNTPRAKANVSKMQRRHITSHPKSPFRISFSRVFHASFWDKPPKKPNGHTNVLNTPVDVFFTNLLKDVDDFTLEIEPYKTPENNDIQNEASLFQTIF